MSKRDLRLERRAVLIGKAKESAVKSAAPSTWTAQRSREASKASIALVSKTYKDGFELA
jgi:hypothetical protein